MYVNVKIRIIGIRMGCIPRFRRFKQWGRYNTKFFWKLDIVRRDKRFPDQSLPAVIQERGIKVEDPNNPDFPRKTTPDPIQLNHPAWPTKLDLQSHPWYRQVPGFLYTGTDPLAEGIHHALVISKSVLRQGIPNTILKASDWLDVSTYKEKVEHMILHSQFWDATIERLPKRRDPILWWRRYPVYYGIPQQRKNELLLDNLFRFARMEGIRNGLQNFKTLQYVRSAPINIAFDRLGQSICLNITPHMTISQSTPSPIIADQEAVANTENEQLADIKPITPTIDLQKIHIFNPGNVIPFSWSLSQQSIHTVLVSKVNDVFYPWSARELTAHAVMAAFGAAMASAKLSYPEAKGILPKPVTAQCIQCCGGIFEFVIFQLNTLDLSKDSGIKNIAYVDGGNNLFAPSEHWKDYENIVDYNPDILKKCVALLSNGVLSR